MEWYKMFNTLCFIAVFSCMHSLDYSMLSICAALLALLVLELCIPNHNLDDAFRNPIRKCHYVKTRIPVDTYKVNCIVADFRKVLAENPKVKQERVLLEDIHPEDEDAKILISCFVENSHYEEYCYVKEAILFDLLEVINLHQPPPKKIKKITFNQVVAYNQTVDGPVA